MCTFSINYDVAKCVVLYQNSFIYVESTILKEWTTPDSRNKPSATNLEEEGFVDALGNNGNSSMPEEFKRCNPWRNMMMMMMMIMICTKVVRTKSVVL
jgi:hypothetical protein